jgi:hypothetical protein
MNHGYYILDDRGVPQPTTVLGWSKWLAENREKKRVAKETIGPSEISTVFLGLDHGWKDGAPIVWETMVFGGPLDQEQDRCAGTVEQAEAMHARMVQLVKESL